ncbi:gag-pol polyprotein [Trichonephila clavipes]|nr:gag-pol polyprotein [Trichonephila clavipes]
MSFSMSIWQKPGKLKLAVAVLAANKPKAICQSRLFVFDKKTRLKFLVDSGSDVSCLPIPEMFKKLSPEPLQLFAANNSKILTYGSKLLNIDLGLRRDFSWKFLIASVPIPIIGADFSENFGLLVDLKRRKLIDSVTTLSLSGISVVTDTISVKLISVHPDDIKKTAKCTPFGLFEFPFLNFGSCGVEQTFQRFLNEILGELRFCYVCLAVFQKLNEYGLTINVSKYVFGEPEISFLGHLGTKNGTKPLPDKVDRILNYPQSKTIKELRRFLGLLNFFRRFLARAAHNQTHIIDFLKGSKRNDNHTLSRIASIHMSNTIGYNEITNAQENDSELINNPQGWVKAVPIPDIAAKTVAGAFFKTWIARFGTPSRITTDQGCQFESRLFKTLANLLGIKRIQTSPYHPQSNGMIEEWPRPLKAALKAYNTEHWSDALPAILLYFRTAYKEDL